MRRRCARVSASTNGNEAGSTPLGTTTVRSAGSPNSSPSRAPSSSEQTSVCAAVAQHAASIARTALDQLVRASDPASIDALRSVSTSCAS